MKKTNPERVAMSQKAWDILLRGGLASREVCKEIRRAYPSMLRGWNGKKKVLWSGPGPNELARLLHDKQKHQTAAEIEAAGGEGLNVE